MTPIKTNLKLVEDAPTVISIVPSDPNLADPHVDLHFSLSPIGLSYLSKQIAKYPFHIGRLLKNSSTPQNMAMLYLQCTSGGLFGHDHICLNIIAHEKSMAAVKHAAATVVHSMQKNQAITHLNIITKTSAYLEYTGNLNILFPNSNLKTQIDVSLHPNSITLISDAYLMHDPNAKSAHFEQLETTINVFNEQHKLLARDRFIQSGSQLALQIQATGDNFDTHASIYLLKPNCASEENLKLLALIEESIDKVSLSRKEAYIGSGRLPNQCGFFVRMISRSGQPVQRLINEISNKIRNEYIKNLDLVVS